MGVLSTLGQLIGYARGIRPTIDYQPVARLRLTRMQLIAGVNRALGYTVAGVISAFVANERTTALGVGIRGGLAVGLVTALASACTPYVEWTADHLPQKVMGVFGVGLILIGFALQSFQYWIALLDVPILS